METPKAQLGTWTLIAPDGTKFKSDSPLKCCKEEQKIRVPKEIAVFRLLKFLGACDLCGEDKAKYTLAERTPAELKICLTCRNTILNSIKGD